MVDFWQGLNSVIASIGITDILDILVVAYLLYHAIRLVRDTRAMQLVKGIAVILILYPIVSVLELMTLTFIIRNVIQWGILALAIVFQPELRRALEHVGRSKITAIGRLGAEMISPTSMHDMIKEICNSVQTLSNAKTGALIVIERETKLGDFMITGTAIDSKVSSALICNIFYPNTPLHDGAMILRDGRIAAAGCFLPLSTTDAIAKELGTRHRAALGMSEESDAIVLVVSEESGRISVAMDAKLERGCSVQNLAMLLEQNLIGNRGEKGRKIFGRKSQ